MRRCRPLVAVTILVAAFALPVPVSGESHLDTRAARACTDFEQAMKDFDAGVLSARELKREIRDVYDLARLSRTPHVAAHATAMLGHITAGQAKGFLAEARDFRLACRGARSAAPAP